MPEFTTVPVQEAQLRTIPGRQGKFINEFADYIQQLPKGQAGRLTAGEGENPLTIRRRLVSAAMALGVPLTIKRSGNDLYFWQENAQAEQPRQRRGRRPRNGRPGSLLPPTTRFSAPEAGERGRAELIPPDQPVDELGMVEQGIPAERQTLPEEDSPELAQTEQVVDNAMRRVDPG